MAEKIAPRGPAIRNGRTGHLRLDGVYDGVCGVQEGATLSVAFRWDRRGARPESVAGRTGTVDGEPVRVVAIAPSPLTEGFYVAQLERRGR